jgi:hypothetical protein
VSFHFRQRLTFGSRMPSPRWSSPLSISKHLRLPRCLRIAQLKMALMPTGDLQASCRNNVSRLLGARVSLMKESSAMDTVLVCIFLMFRQYWVDLDPVRPESNSATGLK